MAWPPGVSDFKAKFVREFVYGDGADKVMDPDITRAISEANDSFDQSCLDTASAQMSAFLYLAAHLMVTNIQTAGGLSAVKRGRGVRNVGEGVQVSKGIGQANVTYQVPPPRIADNPVFLSFYSTTFGQQYMRLVLPSTAGSFAVAAGPSPDQFNAE